MASLNLSANAPTILKSYQSIVNAQPPTGPAASSPTYGQWAVFVVTTPLVSAFRPDSTSKESVLKVQGTGEGELVDLIDEFSEGRIQFAYVKVKDSNTGLFKNVLIGWCGEGVPEHTKGYFTSHLSAVSKFLQGYHIQIIARSDRDLAPESIVQKAVDVSGAKYESRDTSSPARITASKPVVSMKPVWTAGRSRTAAFKPPISTHQTVTPKDDSVDEDGWGPDAPQVTRTQLEKVPSSYQSTRVDIREFTSPKSIQSPSDIKSDTKARGNVVKGGYEPVGKVDIAAIRRQAQEASEAEDDHPEPARDAYKLPDKRATATKGFDADESHKSGGYPGAFNASERLTTLPKPKISGKFSSNSFVGTKAPLPVGFAARPLPPAAPVGSASRTFADEQGKTPAQLWAERKAKERGPSGSNDLLMDSSSTSLRSTAEGRPEGREWKSSYTGKAWAPVQTTRPERSIDSNASQQSTRYDLEKREPFESTPTPIVVAMQDRHTDVSPFPAADPINPPIHPPDLADDSKPTASDDMITPTFASLSVDYNDVHKPVIKHDDISTPEPVLPPTSPTQPMRESSPIFIANSVRRSSPSINDPDAYDAEPSLHAPISPREQAIPVDDAEGPTTDIRHPVAVIPEIRALVQYDYEKAEDNEIELNEGEYVTNIEMVEKDWWLGVNARGERGLFPSNYVEVVDSSAIANHEVSMPEPEDESKTPNVVELPVATKPIRSTASTGPTATAVYDYEASEDNEISFPDGAQIINLEILHEDWWSGEYNGKTGLFPSNYVQLNE